MDKMSLSVLMSIHFQDGMLERDIELDEMCHVFRCLNNCDSHRPVGSLGMIGQV